MTRITCVRAFAGLLAVAFVCSLSSPAFADDLLLNGNIGIKVDENCNGTINGFGGVAPLPCNFQNDPGPGGLLGVMTYNMLNPPGLVAGDVLLFDGSTFLDVIRFNPGQNGGSLLFYSDNVDGFDSGADTTGPPTAFYANVLTINEVGGGAIYTPLAGQPGFVAGASAPVTYKLLSEIPEPATLPLLGSGLIGLAVVVFRKRKRAA